MLVPENPLLISESHIYCVTTWGDFNAVKIATGEEIVHRHISESRGSRLLAVWNDIIFTESVTGITAQRLMTGNRVWSLNWHRPFDELPPCFAQGAFTVDSDARYPAATSRADLKDGVLYVSERNGVLLALDAETGQQLWQQAIAGPAWFIQADADVVYVADTHALHAIRR
jgi:outer membrane protein assembly factor BamB